VVLNSIFSSCSYVIYPCITEAVFRRVAAVPASLPVCHCLPFWYETHMVPGYKQQSLNQWDSSGVRTRPESIYCDFDLFLFFSSPVPWDSFSLPVLGNRNICPSVPYVTDSEASKSRSRCTVVIQYNHQINTLLQSLTAWHLPSLASWQDLFCGVGFDVTGSELSGFAVWVCGLR
jgi:hypothetical protein